MTSNQQQFCILAKPAYVDRDRGTLQCLQNDKSSDTSSQKGRSMWILTKYALNSTACPFLTCPAHAQQQWLNSQLTNQILNHQKQSIMEFHASTGLGLEAMLQITPALRNHCASMVNDSSRKCLTGTKLLRLVSRQCRDIMTREIHGYSLKVQTRSLKVQIQLAPSKSVFSKPLPHPLEEWNFISKAHLLRLTVKVKSSDWNFEGRMA